MIRLAQAFCGSSFLVFPCFPCRLRAGCERRAAFLNPQTGRFSPKFDKK